MGYATKGKVIIDIAADSSMFVQVVMNNTLDMQGAPKATSFTTKELEPVKKAIAKICRQPKEVRHEIPDEVKKKLGIGDGIITP